MSAILLFLTQDFLVILHDIFSLMRKFVVDESLKQRSWNLGKCNFSMSTSLHFWLSTSAVLRGVARGEFGGLQPLPPSPLQQRSKFGKKKRAILYYFTLKKYLNILCLAPKSSKTFRKISFWRVRRERGHIFIPSAKKMHRRAYFCNIYS